MEKRKEGKPGEIRRTLRRSIREWHLHHAILKKAIIDKLLDELDCGYGKPWRVAYQDNPKDEGTDLDRSLTSKDEFSAGIGEPAFDEQSQNEKLKDIIMKVARNTKEEEQGLLGCNEREKADDEGLYRSDVAGLNSPIWRGARRHRRKLASVSRLWEEVRSRHEQSRRNGDHNAANTGGTTKSDLDGPSIRDGKQIASQRPSIGT
ncbi:hypothetical protein HPP92_018073 [Vanilla planifolia]|uniref:Uncharacterized protein n=1 Tax=Vanilla planifolia TaxID=51239 RepID=A0A835UM32_VANPL|nr:hypothetical protein HPP92_018073 [Vanilla planifolia]